MSNKAVIVRVNNGIAYCQFRDSVPVRTDIFYDDDENALGNIYVGYVKDVVKNINCAFVEYKPNCKAYLQLSEKCRPVFLNHKNTDKICAGDRIIIQITKDAMKTKDAVCSTAFELAGKYVVIIHGEKGISFSQKIKDITFKNKISRVLQNYTDDGFGILVRTDAYETDEANILLETQKLIGQYMSITETAKSRTKHYILKEAVNPLTSILENLKLADGDRIVTDDEDIYNGLLTEKLEEFVEFYSDNLLPLYKLCSLGKVFDDVCSRKVWLKSGAYLIIDYTEAMTVIDVNTGKCDKGRDREKTFLTINLEAAREIARQLSLRNISGIIIVDFIDMQSADNRQILLNSMKEYVAEDKIKTNIVDFTKLNLMEITRKKTRGMVKVNGDLFG